MDGELSETAAGSNKPAHGWKKLTWALKGPTSKYFEYVPADFAHIPMLP